METGTPLYGRETDAASLLREPDEVTLRIWTKRLGRSRLSKGALHWPPDSTKKGASDAPSPINPVLRARFDCDGPRLGGSRLALWATLAVAVFGVSFVFLQIGLYEAANELVGASDVEVAGVETETPATTVLEPAGLALPDPFELTAGDSLFALTPLAETRSGALPPPGLLVDRQLVLAVERDGYAQPVRGIEEEPAVAPAYVGGGDRDPPRAAVEVRPRRAPEADDPPSEPPAERVASALEPRPTVEDNPY